MVSSLDDGCWLRCKYWPRVGLEALPFEWERCRLQLKTAVSAWLARAGNRTQALRLKCYFANADSKGAPAKLFEGHMAKNVPSGALLSPERV